MLAAFLTTILFSISAVCGNRTARLLGGTEANFWRLSFATILLALYAHLLGPGLDSSAFPIFFVSGCIGFGIGDVALFQALPRLGSRLTIMLVVCLSAPVAGVIEWLWLGNTITPAEIVCALIILTGVAVALFPGPRSGVPSTPDTRPSLGRSSAAHDLLPGILFGLVAAVCQGYGAVLSRKAFAVAAASAENIDGVTAAYQRILGGVLITALCLLIVRRRQILDAFSSRGRAPAGALAKRKEQWRRAWPYVLVNGLSGPALGVSCFQWALKHEATAIVLPVVAITPLVIIPFSKYLEGEQPSRRSILGGLIAVIGAASLAWTVSR